MPVRVSEIRSALIFTEGMRPLPVERIDLLPGTDIAVRVEMRNARHQLHRALDFTELWTYDGNYPGRVISVRNDQRVTVRWSNELSGTLPVKVVHSGPVPVLGANKHPENEPGSLDGGVQTVDPPPATNQPPVAGKPDPVAGSLPPWAVVHLHGAKVAPDSDGWTENAFLPHPVQPGSQHSHYPPQPRATMLWYHDHAYTVTRLNVYSGLAGAWVIRDPEEQALGLPAEDFEMALILQDRNLEVEGEFLTGKLLHKVEDDPDKSRVPDPKSPTGFAAPKNTAEFFGPFVLVNGSMWPSVPVRCAPYRLRVLNGSNARSYQLFLVDDRNRVRNDLIRQIGTDGGLLPRAVPLDSVTYPPGQGNPGPAGAQKGLILSPAERADLIVDFQREPGRTFRWMNVAAAPYDGVFATDDLTGAPVDPTAAPGVASAFVDRLPYPEVMQFVVAGGSAGGQLALPDTLAASFERWTHTSPALAGHNHRWLGLNEKSAGPGNDPGVLYFNELVMLDPSDPTPEDFSILVEGQTTPLRFRNRPTFFRSPINFYPHADRPEVWNLVNMSADTHPIHVHLVEAQILERRRYVIDGEGSGSKVSESPLVNDFGLLTRPAAGPAPRLVPDPGRPNDPANPGGVDANEAGWKDTVRVNPNEIVSVGMVFVGFTGRFMYHCHILEHEDMDMMRPIVVVPEQIQPNLDAMIAMAGGPGGMTGM